MKYISLLLVILLTIFDAFALSLLEFSKEKYITKNSEPAVKCLARECKSRGVDENFVIVDVTLPEAGTLARELGERINKVDSLVVRGSVNDEDFYTMWSASFYGQLTVLNLEHAIIENGVVPEKAFWKAQEQMAPDMSFYYSIWLRKIILPGNTEEIGKSAFAYAKDLEDVVLPSSLRIIRTMAFANCSKLKTNPLIFDEGLEMIEEQVFFNCIKLREVVFPSSLRELGDYVFRGSSVSKVVIPEGLEVLGEGAFYGSRLEEVALPNSCQEVRGSDHFALNYQLERMHLPDGWVEIPAGFAEDCIALKEVNIPSTVKVINANAFASCLSIKSLDLPEGLTELGQAAFSGCSSIETLCLPVSVSVLQPGSCAMSGLREIYSKATVPPLCKGNSNFRTPFDSNGSGPFSSPVYVPVGCGEAYKLAPGWDSFSHFIEVDDFPFVGVEDVRCVSDDKGTVYDLMGRKIDKAFPGQIYIRNGKKMLSE